MVIVSRHCLWIALLVSSGSGAAQAQAPGDHFERRVRPLFIEHCWECHGPKKAKGGLRLDSAEALRLGGDSGPAAKPGDPDASLMIQAVRQTHAELKMPPRGRLQAQQVADLEAWVREGAVFPGADDASRPLTSPGKGHERVQAAEGVEHWAFQALRDAPPPTVADTAWPAGDIDRFVLAGLEARGLRPAAPADRRTLLRRASFDLTGLPPTAQEIEAFLGDESTEAFARVVDRLLASPRYGERWGRHWLDLARYADSNGSDENKAYAHAWRYRDYVIQSLNADKPFDRFLHEQIAGDLLGEGDPTPEHERWTATGFLVLGAKMLAEQDKEKLQLDVVDEQLDVLGQSVMGMTLGCARCHDHKFDPISTRDYYALAGIFRSTRTVGDLGHVSRWNQRGVIDEQTARAIREHRARVEALQDLARAKAVEVEAQRIAIEALAAPAEGVDGAEPAGAERWDKQATLSLGQAELASLREEMKELAKSQPSVTFEVMAVEEGKPVDLRVHIRGSHLNLGPDSVPRGVPEVFARALPAPAWTQGSGRLELARWLTDARHPLTARVIVNRVWMHHFGQGLVRTPSNFGLRGERPSHPELLDHLARRFMDQGWSLKRLHRELMLSSAYRMSARHDERAAALDPDNRLLWRMPRRRLDVEPIRDALLAVADRLDEAMGGSLLKTPNNDYVPSVIRSGDDAVYASRRRAVYLPVIRNALYPMFSAFDYGDAGVSNGQRSSTTVSPQALFLLNSPLVMEQADALADLALARPGDDAQRVGFLFERLYARPPATQELDRVLRYVQEAQEPSEGAIEARRRTAWSRASHALLAAGEFIHVE